MPTLKDLLIKMNPEYGPAYETAMETFPWKSAEELPGPSALPTALVSKLVTFRKFAPEVKRLLAKGYRKIPQSIFDPLEYIRLVGRKELPKGTGVYRSPTEGKKATIDILKNLSPEEQAYTTFHELGHALQSTKLPKAEVMNPYRASLYQEAADRFSNIMYPEGGKYNFFFKELSPDARYLERLRHEDVNKILIEMLKSIRVK